MEMDKNALASPRASQKTTDDRSTWSIKKSPESCRNPLKKLPEKKNTFKMCLMRQLCRCKIIVPKIRETEKLLPEVPTSLRSMLCFSEKKSPHSGQIRRLLSRPLISYNFILRGSCSQENAPSPFQYILYLVESITISRKLHKLKNSPV